MPTKRPIRKNLKSTVKNTTKSIRKKLGRGLGNTEILLKDMLRNVRQTLGGRQESWSKHLNLLIVRKGR